MRVRNAKVEIFSVKACGYGERVTEFKHFDNIRFYFCGGSGGECADDRAVGKLQEKQVQRKENKKKMFDRLEDLLIRFEEIMSELNEPFVVNDQTRFQKLMKEQSDLQPIVDAYKEYKESKQTVEDSLSMLEEESDEEMREMLKEELNDAKKNIEELEHKLKILLLPKDPNDEKNVIVEIRAGAGGDEAALFAAEIYRMYVKYADMHRWKSSI